MGEKNKEVKEEKKVTTKKETKTDVKKEEKAEQFKKVDPKKIKTDKSPKKESKGKKKATWIIPAVVAVVVLAIIAVLTYMIITSSDPKKTVDGLFTNLKAGDFENAKEFMVSEEGEDEETNLFEDEFGAETKDLLFNTLEWKVNKVTEKNDEAYVEVEITNRNYKTIITNVMQKVLKAAFSGEAVTENSAQNYMVEELKNDQIDKATVVKEIKLVKTDKKWKVAQNEELVDAVLPGLRDAVNTFSN